MKFEYLNVNRDFEHNCVQRIRKNSVISNVEDVRIKQVLSGYLLNYVPASGSVVLFADSETYNLDIMYSLG